MNVEKSLRPLLVPPGTKISLATDYDPGFKGDYLDRKHAAKKLQDGIQRLATYQDMLYAQDTYALLIIFQALDAAGKDGTIKHVMSGINPQGCDVTSFKAPSVEELNHDYLWRCTKRLPERGRIGIFNRSYYEEVLVARVHPEIVESQRLPPAARGKRLWKNRFEDINYFEKYLTNNGIVVLKFFLNVSKAEQKKRFLERIDRAEKNWKFSAGDVRERGFWDAYQDAYQDVFNHTSSEWAPWFIIPADHKWFAPGGVQRDSTHSEKARSELSRREQGPQARAARGARAPRSGIVIPCPRSAMSMVLRENRSIRGGSLQAGTCPVRLGAGIPTWQYQRGARIMSKRLNRREMLQDSAWAGIGVWTAANTGVLGAPRSPNEKLNIAGIGVGGQGGWDIGNCAGENIVAVCDVDDRRAADSFTRFPKAKRYRDFRKMLEEMDRQIDAVVVGTPDHTHAPPAVMAMKMGKHCYCEKPLAHTVHEVRTMIELAKKNKLATQMGTQIHAGANYRRVVELVQSGVIGPVGEVHVWHPVAYGGSGRPKETPPVPKELDWDLWLGPAPCRPYHPCYLPGTWRSWWDFGSGGLGDFGCHYMDLPYWALKLRHPTTIEAEGPPVQVENTSPGLIVRYEFPAREQIAARENDLVRRRQAAAIPVRAEDPRLGSRRAVCGPKGDADRRLWPAQTACRNRNSPVSSRRRRRSPLPSAITPSGSWPARKAARPPATSTIPARWRKRSCWATWPIASARSSNGIRWR